MNLVTNKQIFIILVIAILDVNADESEYAHILITI